MYQQTNIPPGISNVIAISAYDNVMAVKNDGSLVQWGSSAAPATQVPPGVSNLVSIQTKQHTLGLKSDGTVVAWGFNDYGQCNAPAGLSNVVAIGIGFAHSVALRNDGTIVAWGMDAWGQASVPTGLSGVAALSAGANDNLVIATTPGIFISSQPQSILTNVGATVSFSIGASSGVPLNYQWQKSGTNVTGATSSTLTMANAQVSDAGGYAAVISQPSVTVTSSTATLSFFPPPPPSITRQPVSALVLAGSTVTFSASATGALPLSYQWRKNGTNLLGQTGTNLVIVNVQQADAGSYTLLVTNISGSVTSAPAALSIFQSQQYALSPPSTVVSLGGATLPAGLDDVIAIGAGFGQQLAVHSNGTVTCWGSTFLGSSPQPPAGLSNVVAVASCGIHSIALKSDGTVVGWGQSSTPPAGLSNVVAISSGHDHSVALKADGTAVAWGGVSVGPPLHNSNLVAIAAGNSYTLGLCNDGITEATSTAQARRHSRSAMPS
jgi:hypothetical protein